MNLATLKTNDRDGELFVVNADHTKMTSAKDIAPHLLAALENWHQVKGPLADLSKALERGEVEAIPYDESQLKSALPRTWAFLDGSAYIQHILLVRKARGAEPPETLRTVPLMYQGLSDGFLDPREDIPYFEGKDLGLDFEAEVGVITDFVPMGVSETDALKHIALFVLINDVTLRKVVPGELAQGFGFLQSKPASALSPLAITPEELGANYKEGRVTLDLTTKLNGGVFGHPDAAEMFFSFGKLIAHAARTRNLSAGTLVGSGTVANEDTSRGSSCLAERRMLEKINEGEMKTPFLKPGDEVEISMSNGEGKNLFGTIRQKVAQ